MLALIYIFWISCFLIFYNYAGYAILVYLLNRFIPQKSTITENFFPSVSFIVAAFNEEDFIEKKITNSFQQDYPGLIEYIIVTDGSTDRTTEIVSRYPSIRLLHSSERKGKTAAINRAVESANYEVLIFSDANTYLNKYATKNIARHYSDQKVGGVAGEKKVGSLEENALQAGDSEGVYWKYESFLKNLDSKFYSVVGAAGELFSVRRNLYPVVSSKVILDDFVISLQVAGKGYRIIYEPDAYAMELPSFSIQEEQKRKIRIAAGGFQAMGMLSGLFHFWKHPRLSFLYISHRVLRWAVSPFCLILAFLLNIIFVIQENKGIYLLIFVAQSTFYLAAFIGSLISSKKPLFKAFRISYYFVFMNISVILGFFRYLRGKQPSTWEKARRSV